MKLHNVFLILLISILPVLISCNDEDGADEEDNFTLEKPNVYLYPESTMEIRVSVDFPQGGYITESIPDYNGGWKVTADSNGLINGKYTYLYYESTQPETWQKMYGWFVKSNELEDFFVSDLQEIGFTKHEIDDFIEYWIPRLNNYAACLIYPQTEKDMDNLVELNINPAPDQLLRYYYYIKGLESASDIKPPPEPQLSSDFIRDGFVVTEWGVIME